MSTPYRNLDVGATGAIVGSAGKKVLQGYYIFNNHADTVRFLKLYDTAAAPTQASTPVLTLPIPPQGGANLNLEGGVYFANGIGLRATTGVADNDTGAPSSNDVIVNLFYDSKG